MDERHDQLHSRSAGGEREDVGSALALRRPADVIGGDEVESVGGERRVAQRRVDLRLAAASCQLGLVQQQIVRARLGAHIDAVAPGAEHQLDPPRGRDVTHVQTRPGHAGELQTPGDRLVLGHGRARAGVSERVAAVAGRHLRGDPGPDDLIVLGVHSGQSAGAGDRREGAEQLGVGDPRKPLRMGLEGRELERRRAGIDELLHLLDRSSRRDGRPQRDVDHGLPLHIGDLRPEGGK